MVKPTALMIGAAPKTFLHTLKGHLRTYGDAYSIEILAKEIHGQLFCRPEPAKFCGGPGYARDPAAADGNIGRKRGASAATEDTSSACSKDRVVNEHPVRSIEGQDGVPVRSIETVNELLKSLAASRVSRSAPPSLPGRRFVGPLSHSLIDVIHTAFSDHRPLTLSPDAIWMVIAQGFGHHVDANAEELRSQLVRHEGKKTLEVRAQELSVTAFASAIAEFSELIKRETNPVLHETLICDFSTTTPAIRTAGEIALMDTFSHYFEYSMMCVCGIPKITIEGTPEDWRRIRARVEVLATYGLEWWVSRLRPILDEFVLAAEGSPTIEFWQAIYKPTKFYVRDIVTGWIADLFPYLGNPPHRCRSHIFNCERRGWGVPVESGVGGNPLDVTKLEKGVGRGSFPSGLSSARLNIRFPDDAQARVDLLGGFLAMKQDERDLSLSPLISWCVAELRPEQPVSRVVPNSRFPAPPKAV